MKRFIAIALLIFLTSCVNLKPFSVGEDIDASWQIRYADTLNKSFLKLTQELCPIVSNSRVAVLDFVDKNSNIVDENGKYLAFLLTNDLNDNCSCMAYDKDLPQWFDYKNMDLKGYPEDKYEFAIIGSYRYENGCYDVFVRLVDLKEGMVYKTFAFVVYNKRIHFSVEPLTIPNYVEFP